MGRKRVQVKPVFISEAFLELCSELAPPWVFAACIYLEDQSLFSKWCLCSVLFATEGASKTSSYLCQYLVSFRKEMTMSKEWLLRLALLTIFVFLKLLLFCFLVLNYVCGANTFPELHFKLFCWFKNKCAFPPTSVPA